MILSGTLMLPDGDRTAARLAVGSVRIEGGRIVEVHESDVPDHADLGGAATRYLIMPGFTDTHLHLPQFDIIGAYGMQLLDWLTNVTFPAERKWADADYAEDATHRAIDQLLAVGTTGICAYATVHHEATNRAIFAAKQRHIRARIGQVLMDRQAPDYLIRPADQLLDECRTTLAAEAKEGRVTTAVTPRFAITASDALLRGCGKLAAEFEAFVQTHLAETQDECDRVRQLCGCDYAMVYEQAGLLGPRTILGHGIHLNADDRRRLAAYGAMIAHCPTANSFLMSGTMNRQRLMADGVRLTLGSDIGAGYERSMVRVARAMLEAHASLHHEAMSAAEAWWRITSGNAEAAGWENAGRIAVGAEADLLVIEPEVAWAEHADPLGLLLFAWDDRWLRATLAEGEVVYRAGDSINAD